MDYLSKNIGVRIGKLRKMNGMTQEKLSDELNVSIKHISSVERGMSFLSLEKMIMICHLFDCSLDYLVLGKTTEGYSQELPVNISSILSSDDAEEKKLLMDYLLMYSKLRGDK